MNRSVHRVWLVVVAVACLLFTAPAVFAQETSGSVEGTVTGPDGEALPGVSVTVEGTGLPGGRTVVTNELGRFRLPTVPPGTYNLSAQLEGFQAAETPEFRVNLGSQLTVDVPMRLEVGEEILVTSDVPLISITGSDTSATISDEWIEKLPVGRDALASVVTQAAGANAEDTLLGGISIDGSSGSENTWIVDGIDTTDLQTGIAAQRLNTSFTEEVQVKYGGYMPEFRASTGGVINAVTKTGGNEFAGDVHVYYQPEDLAGDQRTFLVRDLETSEPIQQAPDQDEQKLEPGFTLGGPIVRDKAWFFVGYSPELRERERTVQFTDGVTSTVQRDDDIDYLAASLSGSAGPTYYRLGYYSDDGDRDNDLPGFQGTGVSDPAEYDVDLKTPAENITGTLNWLPSSYFQGTLRGGHFEYDAEETGFFTGVWVDMSTGSAGTPCNLFPGECDPAFDRPLGAVTTPNEGTLVDLFERDYGQIDGTFFLDQVAGDHELKLGYMNERIRNEVNDGYSNTRILFYWGVNPLGGDVGQYGTYRPIQINTFGEVEANNQSIFLQDSWRPTDRLTLNLGVRADKEEIPSFSDDPTIPDPAIQFDYDDKIAPRVGIAYDLMGDNRWKAYGSYGVFYDTTKLEMPRGLFGADRWVDWIFALDTFDWPSIVETCRVAPGNPTSTPPGDCPGRLIQGPIDRRHPANDPNAFPPNIDPNLKPMESNEITLGLEHMIGTNMKIGARYVRKRLERTIEDVGIFVEGVGEVFTISNPGEGVARNILGPGFPPLPEAQRDYDGITLEFRKNFSNRWGLNANYTYSELEGNYSGLSSSDEVGRTSPNVNRFFDGLQMLYDANGRPVSGELGTDRPHQFKAQLIYQLPWETFVGIDQRIASGTPQSTVYTVSPGLPFFPYGRGDLGRSDTLTQTDLSLFHEFRLGDRLGLELSIVAENLFDEEAELFVFDNATLGDLPLSEEEFFAGFNPDTIPEETGTARDDRFGLPGTATTSGFQGRRTVRFGVAFRF